MPTKRPFQKPLREGLFKRVKPFGATAPSAPGPSEDGKLKPFPYNCAFVATAREHLDIECTASQLVGALQSAAELGSPAMALTLAAIAYVLLSVSRNAQAQGPDEGFCFNS